MTNSTQPDTRLRGRWLLLARGIGVVIIFLALSLFSIGVPVQYAELQQLCTDPIEVCQQNAHLLYPDNVQALTAMGLSIQFYAGRKVVIDILSAAVACAVGLLIFVRRRDDWLAIIVSVFLVTLGTQGGYWPAAARAFPFLGVPAWGLVAVNWTTFALFFALFPNGRFVPGWMRWVVIIWTLIFITPPQLKANLPALSGLIFPAFFCVGLLAQGYRYRRVSNADERQRTKWVVYGVVVAMVGVLGGTAVIAINPSILYSLSFGYFALLSLANIFLLCIPLSIGLAVLRSRLWDIDLVIRRTLQYSVLSGLLALTYFGLVVVLQNIFSAVSGQSSPVITVLSTLTIAALFLPLRRRVQDFIDRRFYRRKYDAAKVIADFAATCRDETDLDNLTARLVEVVEETMQPESVTLWLKPIQTRPDRFPESVRSESASQTGEQA